MKELNVICQLNWALQALSLEAEEQIASFPDFVVVTDELLLEFDNWYNVAINNYAGSFNSKQIQILNKIDVFTRDLPDGNIYSSEREELLLSSFWKELRELSNEALIILNWTQSIPPKDRSTYIQ